MEPTMTRAAPVFPMRRPGPLSIAAEYDELRTREPVARVAMPTGELVWLITSYEYVRQVLADPRVSADRRHPQFPIFPGVPNRTMLVENFRGGLLGMDPPEHTAHRRLLMGEFTVKRVRAMRPRIQALVDECVTGMLRQGGPVDLVQLLSYPVPAHVVTDMLGMPYADRETVDRCTRLTLNPAATDVERGAAGAELRGLFQAWVARKEQDLGDDLLSRVISRYREAGRYDRRQMAGMAGALLSGGHETTANMISLGAMALLLHPGQLARLRDDPSRMPAAVEEFLRVFSPLSEFAGYRVALADIEVGGVLIRAGEGLIALGSAANRDAAVYDRPDELDISRDAHNHVAFGYGMHQCLGQNLARLELEITLATLFRRIPQLRLAVPPAGLRFKDHAAIYGLYELPVTW
jgi:cytochrome P450